MIIIKNKKIMKLYLLIKKTVVYLQPKRFTKGS